MTGTQLAGKSPAVVSKPNPDGLTGQNIYNKVLPEGIVVSEGRLTILIGLARPDWPTPLLACNTRFVVVWATVIARSTRPGQNCRRPPD